jgi:Tol biopolymer transport system component
VYDLSGATQPTRLTIKDHNLFPTWSPDGKQIAFLSRVGETNHAMVIPSDGSTVQGMPMLKGGGFGVPMAWSPNGEFLLYLKTEKAKLWLLALGDKTERQWLETPFSELGSRFSPDGRWVVFASDQTGASEVWVRPFPGPGAPVRISPDGGQKPLWSKDGKEILYENAGKLWSTGIAIQQSEVRAQPPRVLLEQGFVHDDTDPNMRYVDMARDGRLLVVEPNQAVSDAAIVVAQHWDADLKK